MDIPEARQTILAMLAEKLELIPGRSIFVDRIPPGVRDAASFAVEGVRAWHPDGAVECDTLIRSVSESETALFDRLDALRDLLRCDGAAGILAWRLREPVALARIPGENADLYEFRMPLTVAFV